MGRIVFVNGLIGLGSPPAGEPYFTLPSTPFVSQAVEFFGGTDSVYFPYVDFRICTSAQVRMMAGFAYAESSFAELTSGVAPGGEFRFVAHSMGCAFAEGMALFLLERGYRVSHMIHINGFQTGQMRANPRIPATVDFQYVDDLVIRVPFLSDTRPIRGAIVVREKSNLWIRRRHRGPVYPRSTEFWNTMKKLKI